MLHVEIADDVKSQPELLEFCRAAQPLLEKFAEEYDDAEVFASWSRTGAVGLSDRLQLRLGIAVDDVQESLTVATDPVTIRRPGVLDPEYWLTVQLREHWGNLLDRVSRQLALKRKRLFSLAGDE